MERKHPITVVLTEDEHSWLVRVAKSEDRPPARLARLFINEGLRRREDPLEVEEEE